MASYMRRRVKSLVVSPRKSGMCGILWEKTCRRIRQSVGRNGYQGRSSGLDESHYYLLSLGGRRHPAGDIIAHVHLHVDKAVEIISVCLPKSDSLILCASYIWPTRSDLEGSFPDTFSQPLLRAPNS